MRIEKTIMGEKLMFNVKWIPDTMTAEVRRLGDDEVIIGKIAPNFLTLELPNNYTTPFINNKRVVIHHLKLNKSAQCEAKDYNDDVK